MKALLEIQRVKSKSGKRTMFVPLINGKRISSTKFARKYDAKALLDSFVKVYGHDKLNEMTS